MTADELDAALRGVDVACPDCSTTLDVGNRPLPATDGGRDPTHASDERLQLRGVDVECDCCGADVGVYVFP